MELSALQGVVPGGHGDRIKLFAWWLHTHGNRPVFQPAEIVKCYEPLHIAAPSTIGPYIARLVGSGELLKNRDGYRLEASARTAHDKKYGQAKTTIEITSLLAGLPDKLPNLDERQYLDEALRCYNADAPRGAIVMTWNLAYAHLCDHVVKNKAAEFNVRWQQDYRGDHKNRLRVIAAVTDFADEELNEYKVLKICLDADIITKNVYNVMHAALGRRNAAAHPNSVVLKQLQVDAYIDDLITNAILKIW